VLRGALETIRRHRPVLVFERGNMTRWNIFARP
jgi:hypothetical protein